MLKVLHQNGAIKDDEGMQNSPLRNYNATTEENASSSAAIPAEKSNNGSPSGKDEQDPTSAQLCRKGSPLWIRGKLQEKWHTLSHSPPNSPGKVNPPGSTRENLEDEVMQVDAQGLALAIPQDLAERIDGIQEKEVDPESLLLPEMYSRHVRGELNFIEDVRSTYETLMGPSFGITESFVFDLSLRLMQSSDPIGLMAKNYAIKQDKMIEEQRILCFEDMARLHRQVKERSIADTAQLAKDMQAVSIDR
jgi:hypothetical protein